MWRAPAPRRRGCDAENKTPAVCGGVPVGRRRAAQARRKLVSGGNALFDLVRLAQHIAAAPHGLDEVAPLGGVGELLAQLADEDVDDLQFRLPQAAKEGVGELFLVG